MGISKILIVFAIICLSACSRNKLIVSVGYQDGGNLQKGDKVLLDGIAVGEVVGFHFVPKMVFVDLSMDEGIKIPLSSKFVISKSLLGSASIIIKPSLKTKFITNADTVLGISYKELALDSVKQRRAQAGIQKIAQGLSEVFQALGSDSTSNTK